jgi:hypothetical protein
VIFPEGIRIRARPGGIGHWPYSRLAEGKERLVMEQVLTRKGKAVRGEVIYQK